MEKPNCSPDLQISRLIRYALQNNLIEKEDVTYTVNRLLSVLNLSEHTPVETPDENLSSPQPILDKLLEYAREAGVLESDTTVYRDMLDTELMAALTPRPSEVVKTFREKYARSPREATDWYYAFSNATNYIRRDRIAKDVKWTYKSEYGDIVITINLSKPEKDPVAIAAARNQKSTSYPKCALCAENEGFKGTLLSAARGNHRLIPIKIGGEDWFFQYSPYVYYNEHCIALNGSHVPMKVDAATLRRLFDFLDIFPHYFIGSNAGLPIVGGSILSHDHFQGGRYTFPMEKAPVEREFTVRGYEDIRCGTVAWPLSVIRLNGADREKLLSLAGYILKKWQNYSDESVSVFAYTGNTPHNAITPIARMRGGNYELDLTLRNNLTTPDRPYGLFHPSEDKHHIKKENIGLIEVMGLAVLPSRLKTSLAKIKRYLLTDRDGFFKDETLAVHTVWYRSLLARGDINETTVEDILRDEVGAIFVGCLEDAGVFKRTPDGRAAFERFTSSL